MSKQSVASCGTITYVCANAHMLIYVATAARGG